MINMLKRRFIALANISLLLLLIFIVVGMNGVNYISFVNETDELLRVLSQNKGKFPEHTEGEGREEMPMPPHFSPEIRFESRFFTVLIAKSGEIEKIDTTQVVTVGEELAREYAKRVLSSGRDRGFIGEYRYSVTADEAGWRIVFLDCGRKLDALRGFAYSSVGMAFIGYVILFIAVVVLSGRIIKPISESYVKQKRFITDAGHEIKTPITIIKANLDLYEMENGECEYLDEIRDQTGELSELTEKLVYLAKMEEGETSIRKIDMPLSEVVSDVVASFSAPAQLEGKSIRTEIAPMITYCGDEGALRRLVSVLISNAVKYSYPNSEIEVTLERRGRQLALAVKNNTDASLPSDLSLLFERFYRPDESRTSTTGGHGIGLSIASAIVAAHGGRIYASQETAKTLVITVVL